MKYFSDWCAELRPKSLPQNSPHNCQNLLVAISIRSISCSSVFLSLSWLFGIYAILIKPLIGTSFFLSRLRCHFFLFVVFFFRSLLLLLLANDSEDEEGFIYRRRRWRGRSGCVAKKLKGKKWRSAVYWSGRSAENVKKAKNESGK